MSRPRSFRRAAAVLAFNVVVAVILLELTLFGLLRVPSITAAAPGVVRTFAQKIYRHFQRNIIQYDAACAQYDAALGYTLKPGTCRFANLEFSNEFRINSRGLRDDEDALRQPEVIFLGDSQAMGWAVAQEQAMPQALARKTGLKVLNAAISSYGTARERSLLDTLDRSRLRALVIQYCDNDSPENQAFAAAGNVLPVMSEATYDRAVSLVAGENRYYPGKYSFRLGMKALQLERPETDNAPLDPTMTPAGEARLFIEALMHGGRADLNGVVVVVFEINSNLAQPRSFLAALSQVKTDRAFPSYIRDMVLIETEGTLGPADFFVLDDHLTAGGNDRVAAMVAGALAGRAIGVNR